MSNKIKLAKNTIEKSIIESIVDGPGVRLTLFTQGCNHNCKNCHNPETWDFESGYSFEVSEVAEYLITKFNKIKYYSGLTLSGGDPLYQDEAIYNLLTIIRKSLPELNIWCYTGFVINDVQSFKSLQYFNNIVDGPYVESLKQLNLKFKGSSNQRILKVLNSNISIDDRYE